MVRAWGGHRSRYVLAVRASRRKTRSLVGDAERRVLSDGATPRGRERPCIVVVVVLAAMAPLEAEPARSCRLAMIVGVPIALLVAVVGGLLIGEARAASVVGHGGAGAHQRRNDAQRRLVRAESARRAGQLAALQRCCSTASPVAASQRQFMADASHQLRTPVSVLRATAEVTLSRAHRAEHDYREALRIVGEQGVRLTGLVDAMLLLSRAEAGGRTFVRSLSTWMSSSRIGPAG